jgi:Na+-translocating ferredoxin:NAD+ oxidoreductase RnfD subunit
VNKEKEIDVQKYKSFMKKIEKLRAWLILLFFAGLLTLIWWPSIGWKITASVVVLFVLSCFTNNAFKIVIKNAEDTSSDR